MSGPPAPDPTGRDVLLPSLLLALWYGIAVAALVAAAYYGGAIRVVDERRAQIAAAVLAVLAWLLARHRLLTARHRSAALFNQARDYQDLAIHGLGGYEPIEGGDPGPDFGPGA